MTGSLAVYNAKKKQFLLCFVNTKLGFVKRVIALKGSSVPCSQTVNSQTFNELHFKLLNEKQRNVKLNFCKISRALFYQHKH